MVKSMYAAVAGLNAHQSRMDVISNNIANVNTYGYKTKSASFKESMYQTLSNGSAGSTMDGGYGATNPNLVGYGSMVSAIASNFTTGSPAETGNAMDCFIDGPTFFAVGPMFEDGAAQSPDSIFMTRVGDFAVRDGYLVDGNGRYVYGFSVTEAGEIYQEGRVTDRTESGEQPFTAADLPADVTAGYDNTTQVGEKTEYVLRAGDDGYMNTIKTKGELVDYDAAKIGTTEGAGTDTVITYIVDPSGDATKMLKTTTVTQKKQIPLKDASSTTDPNGVTTTISYKYSADGKNYIKVTSVVTPAPDNAKYHGPTFDDGRLVMDDTNGAYTMEDGVDTLKPLKIPTSGTYVDENGHEQRAEDIIWETFSIDQNGNLFGTDKNKKTFLLGALALVNVPNPAGMEKSDGPYYALGGSSGEGQIVQTGGTAGTIKTGNLEMSNVNIASEFSTMITTERGFQANSKIITVTDEMLQELVNMKR